MWGGGTSGSLRLTVAQPSINTYGTTTAILSLDGSSGVNALNVSLLSSNTNIAELNTSDCVLSSGASVCVFSITGGSSAGNVEISASASGYSTVQAPVLVSEYSGRLTFELSSSHFNTSQEKNGTLTLLGVSGSQSTTVAIASSDTNIMKVTPASCTLNTAANSCTVTLNAQSITGNATVTFKGTNGDTLNIPVAVGDGASTLQLDIDSPQVPVQLIDGTKVDANVSIQGAIPGSSVAVTLSQSEQSALSPRASDAAEQNKVTYYDLNGSQITGCILSSANNFTYNFYIAGVQDGVADVEVSASGYTSAKKVVDVISAQKNGKLTLKLPSNVEAGSSVTGTITLSNSSGIAPFDVTFQSNDTAIATVSTSSACTLSSLPSQSSCSFTVKGVSEGAVQISAIPATTTSYTTQTDSITVGIQPINKILLSLADNTLTMGSSTTGTLSFSDTATAASATVTIASSNPAIASLTQTTCEMSNGKSCQFRIDTNITTGSVDITASANGFLPITAASLNVVPEYATWDINQSTLNLDSGETATLRLFLNHSLGVPSFSPSVTIDTAVATQTSNCLLSSVSPACDIKITGVASGQTALRITAPYSPYTPLNTTVNVGADSAYLEFKRGESVIQSLAMDENSSKVIELAVVNASKLSQTLNVTLSKSGSSAELNQSVCSFSSSVSSCALTLTSLTSSGETLFNASNATGSYTSTLSVSVNVPTDRRFLTIKNYCSGPVQVNFTGGAANTIGCSNPGSTTACAQEWGAQYNDWTCTAIGTANYCKPNNSCPYGGTWDNTSGYCTCTGQECCNFYAEGSSYNSNTNLCYYALDGKQSHVVQGDGNQTQFTYTYLDRKIVLSGNFAFGSLETGTSPMEFTMLGINQDGSIPQDTYDVSFINLINAPMMMIPVAADGTTLNTNNDTSGYTCGAPGAPTGSSYARGSLRDYGCAYDYASRFTSTDSNVSNIRFNTVANGGAVCSDEGNCSNTEVCGLSYDSVNGNNDTPTCGKRIGYWTYTSLCGASNNSFESIHMDINCSRDSQQATCPSMSSGWLGDVGNTCGVVNWDTNYSTTNLSGIPNTINTAVTPYVNADFASHVQPVLAPIKQACPTGYSYQFDDPFSTFQCSTQANTTYKYNMTNYEIHLCPLDGNNEPIEAGISF